jgi:hypothetical protein
MNREGGHVLQTDISDNCSHGPAGLSRGADGLGQFCGTGRARACLLRHVGSADSHSHGHSLRKDIYTVSWPFWRGPPYQESVWCHSSCISTSVRQADRGSLYIGSRIWVFLFASSVYSCSLIFLERGSRRRDNSFLLGLPWEGFSFCQ